MKILIMVQGNYGKEKNKPNSSGLLQMQCGEIVQIQRYRYIFNGKI